MQLILFTKMFRGCTAVQVGQTAKQLGFSGLDVAIRDGHCCAPENISKTLPDAVASWKQMGLDVPMVSLEPTPTDPGSATTRQIFAACQKAGVGKIKLGYWPWQSGEDYWKKFDQIKRDLTAFQNLSREFGVCSMLHTHSDVYYGSNASGAMHLARGFDPTLIGVYLDPAHLTLDGEPFPMALAMAGNYLKAIGVKSMSHEKTNNPNGPRFRVHGGQLDEGLADWPAVLKELRAAGLDVPMSFHAEYSQQGSVEELLPLMKKDLAYLKKL